MLRERAEGLERAVRGRTQEVEQANAEKTRFVAGISHDIRNPLNGIVGLTLALESSALDPRQRELTAAMRGCAKYLDGLVEEVIDFAQIEAGRAALRLDWYSPGEVVDDVLAITRAEAQLNGAVVRAEPLGPLPAQLWGDAGRIRQILVNLTFNAIRHAGGAIAVQVAAHDGPAAQIEFAVQDTGPGIALADQQKVFEPFSRLEAPGRRRVPGSGLGLATSQRWAELMGGSLTIVSQPGSGCRFSLGVPYDPALQPANAVLPALPRLRVLLVEDEDYNAWAAEAVAARVGIHLAARAKSAAEALQLFEPDQFDLILLDRVLPDGDGTAVCRALRERGHRAVKIIALTATATADDRSACLAAGMDAFIGKPLTPEKLRAVLAEWYGGASESIPLRQGSGGGAAPTSSAATVEGGQAGPDLKLIGYLSDGTAEGMAREIGRYQGMLEEAGAALSRAMESGDLAAVRRCSHQLHGLFHMIEAGAGGKAAAAIEAQAREGELPSPAMLQALAEATAELQAELSWAGGRPQSPAPARSGGFPGPI